MNRAGDQTNTDLMINHGVQGAVLILRSTGGKGGWQWILSLQYYVLLRSLFSDNKYQILHEISFCNTCFGFICSLRLCKSTYFVNNLFVLQKIMMNYVLMNLISPQIGRGDGISKYHPSHIRRVYGLETPKSVLRSISTAPYFDLDAF